jgi:hypothetical protein
MTALVRLAKRCTTAPIRWIWCVSAVLLFASAPPQAHPHDPPEIFTVKGTLAKVDLANRSIEVDTIEPGTNASRHLLPHSNSG